MSTNELYAELKTKIDALRRRENLVTLYSGMLWFVSFSFTIIISAGLTELFFSPDVIGRWIIALAALVSVAISCIIFLFYPLLRFSGIAYSFDDITLAKKVGERFPEIKDRLANAIQIYGLRESPDYSDSLVQAALQTIQSATHQLDFTLTVNYSRFRKAIRRCSIVAAVSLTVMVIWYSPLTNAFARLLNPNLEIHDPPPFTWKIMPGNIEILHGQNATITIELVPDPVLSPVLPDRISIWIRTAGVELFKEEMLKKDSAGVFKFEIPNVRYDLFYYATALDKNSPRRRTLKSDDFHITTLKRPAVKRLQIEIDYPDYSGLGTRSEDENIGDVTALKGSVIKLMIETTKPLKTAQIVFSDSSTLPLQLGKFSQQKAEASFQLRRNLTYYLLLKDKENVESSNPVEYRLAVIADEFPLVRLVEPDKDLDINENMTVRLLSEVQDDFGLTKLILHYKIEQTNGDLAASGGLSSLDLSLLVNRSLINQSIPYIWNFSSLGLQPEDRILYYLEVFDNDAVSGPKSSKSEVRQLRFPSLEEILSEVNKEQDQHIAKSEDIVKESEDIRKELEEINKELLKENKKLDWKDKEKIKQLAEKQEKMQKDIEAMKESLDKMTEKMKENKLLSKETLDKYQELQKLLSEVNSKEMQEIMRQLQQAMKNNFDQKQMKDALRNFKFDQESFKKSMDRTVELLKRIKAEQMFDLLKKQAEDLRQRQEQLNELSKKIKNENERSALAKEQEKIKQSLENLEQKSKELSDLVKDIDKKAETKELDRAINQMESGQMQKQMDQSKSAIQGGQQNTKENKQNQQEIKDGLDSLAQQLQKARQEFLQQQNQQIMNAMQKIVVDMLEISKEQERVMIDTRSLAFTSPQFRATAQQQADILSNMSRVTENLIELSNKTFYVTTALGKIVAQSLNTMNDAVKNLEERNTIRATSNQNTSMVAVNDAVKLLLQSMDKINNGQSGTGLEQLMEDLQKMAGRQQGINDGMMPFGEQNPGSMTPEQQAQLGRMMAEQQALRESLENMQSGLQGHQDIKGKLENMAKEMDEVIKDMQKKNIGRETIQRQQKILQRMLDATKSQQEKDQSEKRMGETGKEYKSKSPNELSKDLTDRKNKLRQELLKEMKQGYSKDYEELIKKYFEALGNLNQE
ncbi:hypothetical protein JNM05_15580 [bacterium]|nr:hypothetical protein [bacterium]